MFRKIYAVVLFVYDFDRCLTFYEDTLGLEVVEREATFAAFKLEDQGFVLQDIASSAHMVNQPENAFQPPNGQIRPVLLCTRVTDVDATYAALQAKGVAFTQPPIDHPWGIRAIYFHDPEGNLWEFAQPLAAE